MSDEELLGRIRLGVGYLLDRGRLQQADDIRELCARWAKARADLAASTRAGRTYVRPEFRIEDDHL